MSFKAKLFKGLQSVRGVDDPAHTLHLWKSAKFPTIIAEKLLKQRKRIAEFCQKLPQTALALRCPSNRLIFAAAT
eukprot:1139010-Pelagomonas_calceolata.AAC.10